MITKDKFHSYLLVQKIGATNMFDVNKVISLSGEKLSKEDCFDIMKNYSKYEKKFNLSIENLETGKEKEFQVSWTVWHTVIVKAKNKDEAEEMVCNGNYDKDDEEEEPDEVNAEELN